MWLLSLIFTFFVSGLIVTALFSFLFRRRCDLTLPETAIVGFVSAPIIISFLLTLLFFIFPKHSPKFYILSILIIESTTLLVLRNEAISLIREITAIIKTESAGLKISRIRFILVICIGIFAANIFYQGVSKPIVTHDAIIYAFLGRYIAEERNLDNYPMRRPDKKTGACFSWVIHPPCLPALYSWLLFFEQNKKRDLSCRAVAPIYGIYLLIMLYAILTKRCMAHIHAIASGIIPLIITPVFFLQIIGNSIDPLRIATFALTTYFTSKLTRNFSLSLLILTLLLSGEAVFCHLSNLLVFPMLIFLFILFKPAILFRKTILTFTIIIFCLLQYISWNSPVGTPLYLISLNPQYNINEERRINAFGKEWADKIRLKQVSKWEIFLHERLQIFSNIKKFGPIFYITVPSVIWLLLCIGRIYAKIRKKNASFPGYPSRMLTDILFVSVFFILSTVILIKYYINYRYISTVIPLCGYFIGAATFEFFAFVRIKRKIFYITLKYIIFSGVLVLLFIFTLLLGTALTPYRLLNNKYHIAYELLKLAKWKEYTSPYAYLSYIADEKIKKNICCKKYGSDNFSATTTIIYGRKTLPEFYYYLNGKFIMAASVNKIHKILSYSNSLKYKKKKIFYIIMPDEEAKNLKYAFSRLKLIEEKRGLQLYISN